MGLVVELGLLDLSLCVLYLLSVMLVGLYFTRKAHISRQLTRHRASQIKARPDATELLESYYLGDRKIPWYALAMADVSSYIDLSGTMINTALVYALGVKGMYIEIRGGLCLFLAFQLAYTGKLSRRCPVKTRGEWIKFRFGSRVEAILLRTIIAITSLTSGILATTYFAVGGGKFVTEFVQLPEWGKLPSAFWAAALLMSVAMFYTVASGYTTVVYMDVYQSVFIFTSFTMVAISGFLVELPATFSVFLPVASIANERQWIQVNTTRTAWVSALPPPSLHVPEEAVYAMYNSFGYIIASYAFLQFMRSASGPGGSGLQSILATKSERDVRLQTFVAMALLSLRWAFSAGICILGIQYAITHGDVAIDPERVVPLVISKVLPHGYKGMVLASLVAAALTTFDTTINSASSYWTIDIYQALVHPQASPTQLKWHARISSLVVMGTGLALSLYVDTINRIWGFMTVALAGGYIWPFFFSWYWGRFNAMSCLLGVTAGYIAAFVVFFAVPRLKERDAFAITASISGATSFIACLVTKRTPKKILRRFYRFARPPGAWNDIKHVCFTSDDLAMIDMENATDLTCTGLILVAQLALYVFAVSIVSRAWLQSLILGAILSITLPLIYYKWYVKLKEYPVGFKKEDLETSLID